MATLVKKFGGSSVATPEKMHGIVDRILRERQPDDRIVLVVSAMGDHTDDLLTLAAKVNPEMPKRELDMLLATGEQVSIALMASAFCAKGQPAVSFTGAQAGIKTNDKHSKASILDVQACQVKQALDEGKIVIVAGFQGEITFVEMLELARLGAGVMQPRAVEYGEHNGVAIHVRSTFNDVPGTIIREEYTVQEKNFVIRGVAHDTNVAKIAVRGVSDEPGIAYKIFSALAEANIDVDMIVQSASATDHKNDILFTVTQTDMVEAMSVIESLKETMHFDKADIEVNVAKVSIVGAGMLGSPGIAAGMFGALAKANVNIDVISTSEISVSCLVPEKDVKTAVNAIHEHFFPEGAK